MRSTLNTDLLSTLIREKRGNKGLRDTANEIGDISYATLSRIELGKVPDVDTFIKLCKWLNLSTDTFISESENLEEASTKDIVIAHLRAEKALSSETIDALVKVIDMAYKTK